MSKKKYPLIVFVGVIAAYHIGINYIGLDSNREAKIAQAEAERLQRIKDIWIFIYKKRKRIK